MTTRLKAPEGVTHASVEGKEYEVEADGTLDVESAEHAAVLMRPGHGFTVHEDQPAPRVNFDNMNKASIVAWLQENDYSSDPELTVASTKAELTTAAEAHRAALAAAAE